MCHIHSLAKTSLFSSLCFCLAAADKTGLSKTPWQKGKKSFPYLVCCARAAVSLQWCLAVQLMPGLQIRVGYLPRCAGEG